MGICMNYCHLLEKLHRARTDAPSTYLYAKIKPQLKKTRSKNTAHRPRSVQVTRLETNYNTQMYA